MGTTVTEADLARYVAALVVANDVSARQIQLVKTQFYESKSYPTFTPVGPWLTLVDAADLARVDSLRLTLRVNGEIRQDNTAADMIVAPAQAPLPLTSGTYLRFREIRRDDRHGVCDFFGVPVLPLERCPAGGPGGPVPAGGLSEDLADEQGEGIIAAGRSLAAVRAAGIRRDIGADQ